MCTVCGCGTGEVHIHGQEEHEHIGEDGKVFRHVHTHHAGLGGHRHSHHAHSPAPVADIVQHEHVHEDNHNLHFGHGPAHSHAPGLSQTRMVQIEQDILSKNDQFARQNRSYFERNKVLTLNLVSSPGSGKTTLLVRTIEALLANKVAVIEGDQQTANDAERIRKTGAPAVQVNTGKGCHLDAHMIEMALKQLLLQTGDILFIENVGKLVCPAAFDLGEAAKIAILSVTEGEEKPLKYPDMFRAAKLMLLNKCDLLPYLAFDVELAIANARRVNPDIEIIRVSATTGEGFEQWLSWLEEQRQVLVRQQAQEQMTHKLQARISELEAQLAEARK